MLYEKLCVNFVWINFFIVNNNIIYLQVKYQKYEGCWLIRINKCDWKSTNKVSYYSERAEHIISNIISSIQTDSLMDGWPFTTVSTWISFSVELFTSSNCCSFIFSAVISMIFTANSCPVCLWTHLRTTLLTPLHTGQFSYAQDIIINYIKTLAE